METITIPKPTARARLRYQLTPGGEYLLKSIQEALETDVTDRAELLRYLNEICYIETLNRRRYKYKGLRQRGVKVTYDDIFDKWGTYHPYVPPKRKVKVVKSRTVKITYNQCIRRILEDHQGELISSDDLYKLIYDRTYEELTDFSFLLDTTLPSVRRQTEKLITETLWQQMTKSLYGIFIFTSRYHKLYDFSLSDYRMADPEEAAIIQTAYHHNGSMFDRAKSLEKANDVIIPRGCFYLQTYLSFDFNTKFLDREAYTEDVIRSNVNSMLWKLFEVKLNIAVKSLNTRTLVIEAFSLWAERNGFEIKVTKEIENETNKPKTTRRRKSKRRTRLQ